DHARGRRAGPARPPPRGGAPGGGLLGLVAGGDEPAFAELYQRVAPAVFGLVTKVVRNPAQAGGGTQEGLVGRGAAHAPGHAPAPPAGPPTGPARPSARPDATTWPAGATRAAPTTRWSSRSRPAWSASTSAGASTGSPGCR